ncbi:MAG: phosphoglycerol geranylgeranyltransferase [Chitinophagales bacterium]|nr:phosphoglycerol geranylgeranyltransferase [Chitinophagales bacterium]
MNSISLFYEPFLSTSKGVEVAVLIDPEKADESYLAKLLAIAAAQNVNWLFVGGSTVTAEQFKATVDFLKTHSRIPVIIFPGSETQLHPKADGLLFLSLISGRNPDYLIGKQVQSASYILQYNIPVIPTGYILVDGGRTSTTASVSNTIALSDNTEILFTAMAGVLLGMKALYLEAGSGANNVVNIDLIRNIKAQLPAKLIVGGGIRHGADARRVADAGADVIVIGNALEEDVTKLNEIMFELRK